MKKIYFKDYLLPIEKKAKARGVKLSNKNKKRIQDIYSDYLNPKTISDIFWITYSGIPGPELMENIIYKDNPFLNSIKGKGSFVSTPITLPLWSKKEDDE